MQEKTSLQELISALQGLGSVLICTHISPDPDAIGSAVSLHLLLQSLGCESRVYLSEPVPERLRSLVHPVEVTSEIPAKTFDALIAVDTASKKRICGPVDKLQAVVKQVINIDHHNSNDLWGDLNYIDAQASSTASIILEIMQAFSYQLTPQVANLLFAGLSDDTGCFCFSNATAQSFESAAFLLRAGASPQQVSNALYYSTPQRVVALRARALSTLRLVFDQRVACAHVSLSMLNETKSTAEDCEGIVDLVRSIEGTVLAVFFREMADGWKLSLRSKVESLDVDQVAAAFGGGGHRAAAGCKISGSLPEVEKKIFAELAKIL